VLDRLGAVGVLGVLVLVGGLALLVTVDPVIAAGVALVVAGLGLVAAGLLKSVMSAFGMA